MSADRGHFLVKGGETPKVWMPGDVALVYDHKPTLIHEAIQCRERTTAGHTAWANLTHCVCVTEDNGGMVEANAPGIQAGNMKKYDPHTYWVVDTGLTPAQRVLCVDRWKAQIGTPYDDLAFGAEAGIAFGFMLNLGMSKHFICSGLGCYGLLAGIVDFELPFSLMTPADIGKHFNLPIDEEWVPPSFTGRQLDRVVLVGRLVVKTFRL